MGAALDIASTFFKRFEVGDLEGCDELFDDNCRFEMPSGSMNKGEHRQMSTAFKAALPDARMEIVHSIDGGDEVFIEGRFRGTHKADFMTPQGTIPASGQEIDVPFGDYFEVRDGRIVNHRTYWDQMTMMAQLGVAP